MSPSPSSSPARRPAAVFSALLMLTMGLAQAPGLAQVPGEATVDPPFLGLPSYEEDFQDDEGGWENHTQPAPPMTWEHGEPTSGPGDASGNVWATNLDGDYRPYECGVLMSAPIDLTGASTAEIAVDHAYEFYESSLFGDGGAFLVTTDDGDTFERVVPEEGYDARLAGSVRDCLDLDRYAAGFTGSDDGRTSTIDLDAFTGDEVRLALGFASGDSSQVREGWYLDGYTLTVDGETETENLADEAGFTYEAFEEPEQPVGWEWGTPTSSEGPTFQEPTNLWGINLDGDHGRNECSTIESPPIQLDGSLADASPEASLVWDQWYRSSSASGGGVVQIGVDGEYYNVEPEGGYPGSPDQALDECLDHRTQSSGAFAGSLQTRGDDMAQKRADVSEFLGEEITVRFVFATTDSIYQVDGWYVNDVAIEVGAGPDPVTVDVPEPDDVGQQQVFQPLATVYEEDFEDDDGGWSTSAMDSWEHGSPVHPPEVPAGSLNMWGTNLLGDTDQGVCSYLDSPTIELPNLDTYGTGETLQLTLDTFRDLAPYVDGAAVWVNDEDGDWYRLTPDGGYDAGLSGFREIACLGGPTVFSEVWTGSAESADDWHTDTFDLSRFAGEAIEIQIAFASGVDQDHRGIYLDEARIDVGAGADVEPGNLQEPGRLVRDLCQEEAPGWNVQGATSTWCRNVPTTGPSSLEPVWATDPHGTHTLGECSFLTTEPLDVSRLPGLGPLTVSFEHFLSTGRASGAVLQVSETGDDWRTVKPDGGYDTSSRDDLVNDCLGDGDRMQVFSWSRDSYEAEEFTLRGYDEDTIQLRFAFAGMNLPDLGWYVRNVQLDRGLASLPVEALAPGANATSSPALPADSLAALEEIGGPDLREAIEEGDTGPHEVVVTGPQHDELPTDVEDREAVMAFLDEQAAPFFETVETAVDAFGGQVTDRWASAPAVAVEAPLTTLAELAELPGTRHMAKDEPGTVELIEPLPPSEEDGPSLMNTEGRQLLEAEQAWAEGYRGEDVTISVIDTGIAGEHEAFRDADGGSRVTGFLDLVNGLDEAYDDHGHGTHVAGSAAGSSLYEDPTFGTFEETGVAPRADLLGVKFLNAGGAGSLQDAITALEWSYEQGANITSNSWGANCEQSASIISTVSTLRSQGMLSVFAAGNAGPSPGTVGGPACGEDSLAVGATDADAEIASFSSRGPCSDPTGSGESRVCPDVAAKGASVRSAVPRDGAAGASADGYRTWSGTSMATPQVAGAAAIMEQMKTDLTGTGWDTASGAEFDVIKGTAEQLPSFDSEPNNDYGWGLPQLMGVHAVLTAGEEASVEDTFYVEDDTLRIGERTDYRFTVRNYGTVPAEGPLDVTLTHPDGAVDHLHEGPVELSYLDVAGVEDGFPVQGNTLPGEYVFAGSFPYTWEDPDTGEIVEGEIEHETTFTVVRPYLELAVEDLPEQTPPGVPQDVAFTATNTGNEDARDTELRLTVPDTYEFVPPDTTDPTQPESRYSDPAPDRTVDDGDERTLVYDVGTVPIGEQVGIDLTLVATQPGEHRLLTVGAFTDAEGHGFAQGQAHEQTVQGPATLVAPLTG